MSDDTEDKKSVFPNFNLKIDNSKRAANKSDYEDDLQRDLDIFEVPEGETEEEFLERLLREKPKPKKLFEEFPQGNPSARDSDIHDKDEWSRKMNRRGNVASNCYFYFYEQLIKNYPEDYEVGSIEIIKMIDSLVLFMTHMFSDIVQSGAYDADDTLKLFYENLAQNYQYLTEISKPDHKQELYGSYKTLRLRKIF